MAIFWRENTAVARVFPPYFSGLNVATHVFKKYIVWNFLVSYFAVLNVDLGKAFKSYLSFNPTSIVLSSVLLLYYLQAVFSFQPLVVY